MYTKIEDDPAFSLESTVEFINDLEKVVNELRIYTRRIDQYPFDTVAGESIAKAFVLCRAVITLVQHNFSDEAFGLCRSLYELAIYLRYITREPELLDERARAFIDFGTNSKAFWADILNKSDTLTDQQRYEIDRYVEENKIPDDPKIVTQPWSGVWRIIEKYSKLSHPTDAEDSDETFRDRDRAVSYTDASSYVHCTQPALNSYAFACGAAILLPKSRAELTDKIPFTCAMIHSHLRAIVRYCLFGMKVVLLDDLRNRSHPSSDITWNPKLHA